MRAQGVYTNAITWLVIRLCKKLKYLIDYSFHISIKNKIANDNGLTQDIYKKYLG